MNTSERLPSRRRQRRGGNARRGAAVAEFAVVLPIIMLFTLGVLEVGRAVMVQQLITNASREGARVASYESTTAAATVTSAVNAYLSNAGVNGATTSVSPNPPANADIGQQISVTVSVPFSSVSWSPSPFLFNGKTLSGISVMRRQPAP